MKSIARPLALLLSFSIVQARQYPVVCGTGADSARLQLQLHQNASRKVQKRTPQALAAAALPDAGQIAILDDSDGVVARRNDFNLNKKTVRFVPVTADAARYRVEAAEDTYDAAAGTSGELVSGIGDDDTRELDLPFSFPFFGVQYKKISLNSDGNLTFATGDPGAGERSLGRMTAGPARIAPLFVDLDPTQARQGIRVLSEPGRYVVSWVEVPEYSDFGTGLVYTFQARLFPDGRIEFAYSSVIGSEGVLGIAPGRLQGATSIVDFAVGSTQEYSGAVAERFIGNDEVDIYTAAQKFYLNHEDSYDYLVFYNTLGVPASSGAVAYEVTVRNNRSGFGDIQVDLGFEAGSKRRLQAMLNMGPLSQYPADPNAIVPARSTSKDTPLTVLGHETGHLFLAFASVRNPGDPEAQPMLGRSLVHWNFAFNSEASLLEGNRIRDNGPGVTPRFTTTGTVEGYAPLDQYLMGFIPPQNVPDTFLVQNATSGDSGRTPQAGISFNGTRRDIHIDEIVQAEGRRTPDHTVSQRHFRFAFVLVTKSGTAPTADQLQQLDNYRSQFEGFYSRVSSQNSSADTSLKKALRVSTFPAAGVLAGSTGTGKVAVESAVATPLTVMLRSQSGAIGVPASVTIPAGGTEASFSFTGLREGVDELVTEASSAQYEMVNSRIQVAAVSSVKVSVSGGDNQRAVSGVELPQPVSIRVTDVNGLPYPGLPVQATVTSGGTLNSPAATTDENGVAQFRWKPGSGALNVLRASVTGGASVAATALVNPSFTSASVVNAASFAAGISPGGIATIFGVNLTTAKPEDLQVTVNGRTSQVFYFDNGQINFQVPASVTGSTAEVVVKTPVGSSTASVPLVQAAPGIFFDTASGFGAVLNSGTGLTTSQRPPATGDAIEIYATGLGPLQNAAGGLQQTVLVPEVVIGGVVAKVLFSGLAPGFPGLYQVNVQVPGGVASGVQALNVAVNGIRSNDVKIRIK
jgi:uncharacterized protein (TIGR03437 family)